MASNVFVNASQAVASPAVASSVSREKAGSDHEAAGKQAAAKAWRLSSILSRPKKRAAAAFGSDHAKRQQSLFQTLPAAPKSVVVADELRKQREHAGRGVAYEPHTHGVCAFDSEGNGSLKSAAAPRSLNACIFAHAASATPVHWLPIVNGLIALRRHLRLFIVHRHSMPASISMC